MIYAVGGRDDCTELSSAERYNPATNTWSPIVAMMSRRSGVRITYYLNTRKKLLALWNWICNLILVAFHFVLKGINPISYQAKTQNLNLLFFLL